MLLLKIFCHSLPPQITWRGVAGSTALLCFHWMWLLRESQENLLWRIVRCVGFGGGVSCFLLQPRDAISVFQALKLEKTWNRFYRKIYAASEDKCAHARNYCSPVSLLKSNSVSWVTSINYCAIVFPFFNELVSLICMLNEESMQSDHKKWIFCIDQTVRY